MLSRKEAAKLLNISITTFKRRVKTGVYGKGVSTGEQTRVGESTRTYTYADIGLDQDGKPSACELQAHPETNGLSTPESSTLSPILLPYEDKPERFKINDVAPVLRPQEYRDSLGNAIGDPNPRSLIDAMFGTTFFETSVPKVERIRDPYGDRARALAKRRNSGLPTGYGITPEQLEAAISKGKRS